RLVNACGGGDAMRSVDAAFEPGCPGVHRVVLLSALAAEWQPGCRHAVVTASLEDRSTVERMRDSGLEGVRWVESRALHPGDVVVPSQSETRATVLYRESDIHH